MKGHFEELQTAWVILYTYCIHDIRTTSAKNGTTFISIGMFDRAPEG